MKEKNFKSGFVALLGKPNVGKSTLLNYFLEEKLSIVSPKPQTTRDSILGICSKANCQIIFVDTPGVHTPKNKLGRHMVNAAKEASSQADEILVVIDASAGITKEDYQIFNLLKIKEEILKSRWVAVLINKIDLVKRQEILPLIDLCQKEIDFSDYIPISAKTGENLEIVQKKIIELLPEGPAYYPAEQLTDKNERFIVAELIREQALNFCHEEVPYSVAVEVETFKESNNRKTLIQATIYVERSSQKAIIIGKEGQMLKKIGSAARIEIEQFLDKPVFLELWVKVHANWRKDEHFLRQLGYKKL